MPKYSVTIEATYEVELEDLDSVRQRITDEYTLPELPDFISEDFIEYLSGSISYELLEDN